MVVDDSITMRKVTGACWSAELRRDHGEGRPRCGRKLHEQVPDLMLLDIEMPRMDGYELATYMQGRPAPE